MGGGITVEDIINQHTHGPHWKEFSLQELRLYFELLLPDFFSYKVLYVDDYGCQQAPQRISRLGRSLAKHISILRPNLHIEIDLVHKERGIAVAPAWVRPQQ
jgi:hypothetical protein